MSVGVAAPVVEPGDLAEARDALTGGGALLFRGGGTKLDWGPAPTRVDTLVSTARLNRLLSHDPADMTASAEAGIPLARLQEHLAEHDQWLAIDPPLVAEGATLGGVLAAGDAGPCRLRYGTMRDLVIGTTTVLAGGAISRSGGKVIKNVAGYDLGKLVTGSYGTLGLVAEVVVRVHPRPATTATLRCDADAAAAGALTLALLGATLEPVALDWHATLDDGQRWGGALLVRYQGRAEAVAVQVERTAGLAREHGASDPRRLAAEEEQAAWDAYRAGLAGSAGDTVVRAGTRPAQLVEAADALARAATEAGVAAELHSHTGIGAHTARLVGGDAAAHAAVIEAWRGRLAPLGGHAVVRRHVDGLGAHVDLWGPAPSALGLMRRVKAELDPDERCAPGRFVGGI